MEINLWIISEYLYDVNGKSIKSKEPKELVELGIKNGDSLIMKKKLW